jgi:hypothetical protein
MEIGRVMKIVALPLDMLRDSRILSSMIGPSTKPRTQGTSGHSRRSVI